MSKYIDADLYVEMQIYDDEHEEWGEWQGTIEDLLDQWTEQGRPTPIEVSKDCISRAELIKSFLDDNECKREEAKACMCSLDLMLELIEDAPSVTAEVGGWKWEAQDICDNCGYEIPHLERVIGETVLMDSRDWGFCPNCGSRRKGN